MIFNMSGKKTTEYEVELEPNQTSVTLKNLPAELRTLCVDVYTTTYGINPTNVYISAETSNLFNLTLEFEALDEYINVKVRFS